MRLLITTQAVDADDPALGFFTVWLERFATRYETIEIICLTEGKHALPANVHVHSLGKERGVRSGAVYAFRFWRLLSRLRGRYDTVFVHMNPEYVILGAPWWRLSRKRVVLWYTHRQVNVKLRAALFLADVVATAAPESFRLASPKVHVVGQGIDTAAFWTPRDGSLHGPVALVSVGRIAPIKRLEILLEALALLTKRGIEAALTLVGIPTYASDQAYAAELREQVRGLKLEGRVRFRGALPFREMPRVYRAYDLSVNLAPTGGIDKAVLEGMAAGCIPVVANRAFAPLFGEDAATLMFDGSAEDLAEKLETLITRAPGARAELARRLAERVRKEADISVIIERLVALLAL